MRVVRADFFSTKGQGFLYVEARTTKGAQTTPVVAMTLESDTGEGTAFVSPRTMSRFVDSGEYMFHRNLFKVDMNNPPKRIRVTSTISGVTDGQTIGTVSKWLDDVTPLTANPNYKSDFVDDYKHPQQLYGALRAARRGEPGDRRDRGDAEQDQRLPAQGAGHDRLHDGHGRAVRGGRQLRRLGA